VARLKWLCGEQLQTIFKGEKIRTPYMHS